MSGIIIPRRRFLMGVLALVAAPAVVRMSSLMPVRAMADLVVDPPIRAVGQVIFPGVHCYAGGITWVDAEYDERIGAALSPLFS